MHEHIELDLPSGTIAVFTVVGRELEHLPLSDPHAYVSPALRGVKFSSENDQLSVFFPDGRAMGDRAAMLVAARQDADIALAQANDARAEANDARVRADRLAEQLRALGVEPD